MTVTLRSGTPSSGKSYMSITDIWSWLHSGRLVIANFDVNFSKRDLARGYDKRFFHYPNSELTVEALLVFAIEHGMVQAMKEEQCLVVIDEAGGRFNVAENKSEIGEWKDFFSQHAKLGYSFVLVAQKDKMINKQILSMVEYEIKHRKVNRYKFFKHLPFTLFVSIRYWYVNKQREGADYDFYMKKIANRYNRYKMFDGFKLSSALLSKINDLQANIGDGYTVPISAISTSNEDEK